MYEMRIPKDPDSVLDYTFVWTQWLADKADTITSYAVAIDGVSGLAVDATDATPLAIDAHLRQAGVVTVWLSGGTAGAVYIVRCRIVTVGGRTEDRSFLLRIAQR